MEFPGINSTGWLPTGFKKCPAREASQTTIYDYSIPGGGQFPNPLDNSVRGKGKVLNSLAPISKSQVWRKEDCPVRKPECAPCCC